MWDYCGEQLKTQMPNHSDFQIFQGQTAVRAREDNQVLGIVCTRSRPKNDLVSYNKEVLSRENHQQYEC